ncbi:MAG: menaquinone biosynthesis decarboxylase [Euryarchaeota archaeon]|nr:menaquinone biosynthesis decarboxylase [Euryarchaeota archaeon]
MGYRDLSEWIETLESKGELRRVKAPVNVELEISEITDRVTKTGGPALLFENPKGYDMPVFINGFGTETRMNMALETRDPKEIGERLVGLMKPKIPRGLGDIPEALDTVKELFSFPPKKVSNGPVKDIIATGAEVDITRLPVLKCWPGDGGRFITLPLVITQDPETGTRNVGTYRMQVFDKNTTAMHWQTHKGGAKHFFRAEKLGQRLDVAVAIGSDPATMLAGIMPLPEEFDEFMYAGFVRGERVPLVKCETNDLMVPANAEIVLEGYVDPGERRVEGPFGDHTGYYSLDDEFPVFHVTALTRREKPVYATTIVGKPPQEDGPIGKAVEQMFLPMMQLQFPEIVDINLPVESIFHNLAIVSIKKRYPHHAKKVMMGLWGLGQMMFTKIFIVVDDDVDVHNMREVLWAFTTRYDPARDTVILSDMPADTLDHVGPRKDVGGKAGIDATKKWKEEGFDRRWPDVIEMDDATRKLVDSRWREYGLGP